MSQQVSKEKQAAVLQAFLGGTLRMTSSGDIEAIHPQWRRWTKRQQTISGSGYAHVMLTLGRRRYRVLVHHVVMLWNTRSVFPDGLIVNHKDSNPANNHPDNLELVTPRENVRHAMVRGRFKAGSNPNPYRGADSPSAKLTQVQVSALRQEYATGKVSQRTLAQKYSMSQSQVGRLVRFENWKEDRRNSNV